MSYCLIGTFSAIREGNSKILKMAMVPAGKDQVTCLNTLLYRFGNYTVMDADYDVGVELKAEPHAERRFQSFILL